MLALLAVDPRRWRDASKVGEGGNGCGGVRLEMPKRHRLGGVVSKG